MFIAFMVTSFACADPIPKAPPEPAWMANFRKAYELKEGQYVKRVAPPYIPERIDFIIKDIAAPISPEIEKVNREEYLKNGKRYSLFFEQTGTDFRNRMSISTTGFSINPKTRRGDNLWEVSEAVRYATGMYKQEFSVDPKFAKDPLFDEKNLTVNGDFVVRFNAPVEKLAIQLETILRNECKVPCKLRVDTVEQEVYIA